MNDNLSEWFHYREPQLGVPSNVQQKERKTDDSDIFATMFVLVLLYLFFG